MDIRDRQAHRPNRYSRAARVLLLGVAAIVLSAQPTLAQRATTQRTTAQPHPAQPTCAMREDLASHAGLHWADLRSACEAEQTAYKEKNRVGFTWFANAANGFAGFPYLLQRVLPELAPEIWGRPEENFAR